MPSQPRYATKVRKAITRGKYARVQRLYQGRAATPSSSTLAATKSSFRYSNPMSISLSNVRTMSFTRTVSQSLTLNEASGWGGLGSSSINFGFSLAQVLGFQGGAFTYGITMPNAAEFTALFDYYKIGPVKMTVFFSNNLSSVNSPATGMPILLISNDYDNVDQTENVQTMYERAGTRTIQFTADNHNGINHYCKPCSTGYVLSEDGSGIVTSNAAAIAPNQWLDCNSPGILHSGIKVFYNNQGRNNDVDIGSVTFVFEVTLQFKGYR